MNHNRRKSDQYISDKESIDLETHVLLSSERCANIHERLDNIEDRLDNIHKDNMKIITKTLGIISAIIAGVVLIAKEYFHK